MDAINWWLIALAFVLGFVLTLAFTIRRVTREVPVYATSVPSGDAATLVGHVANDDDAEADSVAGAEHPYGAGSVRLVGGTAAPPGWTIKGNEDSMLYHTPESPSYDQTIAELWFRDEESAESAGFARWDSGKSERGQE